MVINFNLLRTQKARAHNHFIRKRSGFTLIEAVITVAIVGILLGVGVPAFLQYIYNQRLRHANEQFFNDVKYAQSEAIRRQVTVYVSIKGGTNWCYGVDDSADCDCSVANSCQIGGATYVVNGNDYNITSLTVGTLPVGVAGAGSGMLSFDGTRGTSNSTGTATFQLQQGTFDKSIATTINRLGHMSSCGVDVTGYNDC